MFRKLLSTILIISFVIPLLYLPSGAKRVEAGIPVIDVERIVRAVADGFAMFAAQTLIDRTVSATVSWAQSGFEGNPAYVTDPARFFTDIADGVAGEFILGDQDLSFLCSPFQANIRISLIQQYYQPRPFQCTLTQVVGNIEDFYNDFNSGGWDAWFTMTQVPTNNPQGAYLQARIELDSRVAKAVGLERSQLDWNQGFRNWAPCLEEEPGTGKCLKRDATKTPGAIIKSQLDQVLPSGLEKLVTVQHVEQLISAFAAGLLQRYVFGPKGLFASGGVSSEDSFGYTQPTRGAITRSEICDTMRGLSIEGENYDQYCISDGSEGSGGPESSGTGSVEVKTFNTTSNGLPVLYVEAKLNGSLPLHSSIRVGVYNSSDRETPLGAPQVCYHGSNLTNGNTCTLARGFENGEYYYKAEVWEAPGGNPIDPITFATGTFVVPFVPGSAIPETGGGSGGSSGSGGGSGAGYSDQRSLVQSMSQSSTEWQTCKNASTESGRKLGCFRFTVEVARELAKRDSRWGLLTKNPSDTQCTLTACGNNVSNPPVFNGYGEDIITYRLGDTPTGQIKIVDIVDGAGSTNPKANWHEQTSRRSGNNWAPVI